MIPNFTEEQYKQAGCKDLLPLSCVNCSATFYNSKHQIYKAIKGFGGFKSNFCSTKCSGQHKLKTKSSIVSCHLCSKSFSRTNKRLKQSKLNFCSSSCSAKYYNARKVKGTRVSKLELFIQQKLSTLYPNLSIIYNSKEYINSELDIYIPSLNLAFELNGIFHYEPIYGDDKLKQIQNNDTRKFQACLEKGIELCILDTSKQSRFTESSSNIYITIITNIINNKLG